MGAGPYATEFADFVETRAIVVADAAAELAPLGETGHLRGGRRVEVQGGEFDLRVYVVFGGLAQAYAEVQHERDDYRHPRGGQSHFLDGRSPAGPSAWEQLQVAVHSDIDAKAAELLERAIGGEP
jgi:hypothetical protein